MADLFLSNSEHCCKDPEAFKAEMTSLVNSAREDTIALSQVSVLRKIESTSPIFQMKVFYHERYLY